MKYLISGIFARIIALLTMLASTSAWACDVPVFRYALERWRPAIYRVLVYHRGALSADQQSLFKSLEALSVDREGLGNFSVERIDLDGKSDPDALVIFKAQPQPVLPWMVVCYPDNDPSIPSAWAGPLSAAGIRLLANSPARKSVARNIVSGDSAVVILLTCGDAALDDAVAKTLGTELKRLESAIKLPEDPAARPEDKPLKVSFSMVRVSRDDPAEAVLVGNLLRRDPEVAKRREPIAFPVFGRGRALCALVGEKMITRENLEPAAKFLTGPCSCEVKDQNPGMDLLMSADWDTAFATAKPDTTPLPTLGPPLPERTPAVAPVVAAPAPSGALYRNVLITLGAAVLITVGIAIIIRSRSTGNQ